VAVVAAVAFVLGVMAAGALAALVPAVGAQPRQRFEVERGNGVMFIRDTRMSACYVAIEGGGILQAQCPL
jgi:hypothetical protein